MNFYVSYKRYRAPKEKREKNIDCALSALDNQVVSLTRFYQELRYLASEIEKAKKYNFRRFELEHFYNNEKRKQKHTISIQMHHYRGVLTFTRLC